MKRKLLSISMLIIAIAAMIIYGCKKDEDDDQPQNTPPTIHSISSTPNTSNSNRLPAGSQATISVMATDPDKDNLNYSWEADDGNFVGDTDKAFVTWQSPVSNSLVDYEITATISDGAETISKSINIYVDKVMLGINATPKTFDFGTSETEYQVKIFNTGEGILKWETYGESASWLTVNPTSGTINSPNDTAYVSFTVNRDGLSPDNYSEEFRFGNVDDINNYVSINVEMDVAETVNLEGYTYYASTTIPVSGVMVTVGESNSITGTDGFYGLTDVLTGSQTLTATKEGYDAYSSNIQISLGTNEYNIEMTSTLYTHNLFGIITNELSGNPISNADVVVLNPDGTESDLKTTSSSSGHYQIPTVPQGNRTVRFTHEEYQDAEIDIFMVNSNYELNFEMSICLPMVTSGNYELLYPQIAEVNGNITSLGCSDVTEHGHCWSEYSNPTIDDERTELGDANITGSYTSQVVILKENTQYHIRAYATNSYGTFYGEDIIVTSGGFDNCGTINYGGITYETVQIGEQCWMKENLNYQTSNSWCHNNNPDNCDTYGRLYIWHAIMNGESSSNQIPSGVQGICPDGWHVPSDAEWDLLVDFLGGESTAGGKMKQPGTSLWDSPNTGARNSSGYSALPSGTRSSSGIFDYLGRHGIFWSSTESFGNTAWDRRLKYHSSEMERAVSLKGNGFSVRCVKD